MKQAPQSTPSQRKLSIYALAKECGSAREDVAKWLQSAGKDTANLTEADAEDCVRIIRSHQSQKTAARAIPSDGAKAHFDEDGLLWAEAKQKQDARKLQRENLIADKQLAELWMTTEAHHRIVSNIFSKIEQVPQKFKSESGCSAASEKKLRDMLDQARHDAAAEERKAFEDGKKRVVEASK